MTTSKMLTTSWVAMTAKQYVDNLVKSLFIVARLCGYKLTSRLVAIRRYHEAIIQSGN